MRGVRVVSKGFESDIAARIDVREDGLVVDDTIKYPLQSTTSTLRPVQVQATL
jgi:hypothetical protein